jgi:SAM-dependent methyltransferase
MAEQVWDSFARLNAGERFKRQSAEMGTAVTAAIVEEARIPAGPTSADDGRYGAPAAGMQVLDIACGSGEPSISIAALVRGTEHQRPGRVVGVDLATAPLEVARERAAKRGLENVEYLQADVHALPFAGESFDRVTSRLGVMFFSDLPKALSEMHRVLKPGGRVSLLAWGAMEQPYFAATIGTILRMKEGLEVPASGLAMFKFGNPGTLSGALGAAGFAPVEERVRELRWDWHGTPEEMWDYFRGVTVPFRTLLEKVDGDAEVDAAVLEALRERFDGEWIRFEAQMVVASGTRG